MSLETYLHAAPKAELHVHLEGAIQPATLLALAARNRVDLPVTTEAALRDWFTFRDFAHFVEIYLAITGCLRTADDYELVVHELGAEMARQNVRYAEVTFSPSTHDRLGVPHDVYFSGLTRGRARAKADFGVEIVWVFDLVRSMIHLADYTTGVAIEGKDDGVVAFGLGGTESLFPPEPFAPYFDRAIAAGLRSAPHAGETAGPASIWGAIQALGAERIGHGVRAVEDPALIDYLVEHQIPIEVNPTSNIRLGVYPSLTDHSLPRLHAAGVPLTVNSDDPPLFNTTLNTEIALLADPFGFDLATIDEILLNGVRHSFLPPPTRQAMEESFRAEMTALKQVHLVNP